MIAFVSTRNHPVQVLHCILFRLHLFPKYHQLIYAVCVEAWRKVICPHCRHILRVFSKRMKSGKSVHYISGCLPTAIIKVFMRKWKTVESGSKSKNCCAAPFMNYAAGRASHLAPATTSKRERARRPPVKVGSPWKFPRGTKNLLCSIVFDRSIFLGL